MSQVMTEIPEDIRSVYMIGIAGIGMSGLARHFKMAGAHVEGYDRDRSSLAEQLEAEGIAIHYDIDPGKAPDKPDLVIYTPAIPDDHAELAMYRSKGIPVVKRAEVLGHISRQKRCIAVAGTHGKTTTSAMIAFALKSCDVDCTAFLGGISIDFGGNYVYGEGPWMVAEADEYDRSFLQLEPEMCVITSIDPDHLDVYGTGESMREAFGEFALKVRSGGTLIISEEAWDVLKRALGIGGIRSLQQRMVHVVTYGFSETAEIGVQMAEVEGVTTIFRVAMKSQTYQAALKMPGRHNVLNATAAIAVGHALARWHGGPETTGACVAGQLRAFRGIERRFEIVYADNVRVMIDDYAHHPAELRAVISAVRLHYPGKRITGVFQPHLYSRTRDFYKEFAQALSGLDTCILVELYPAREQPIEGVSSELIFRHLDIDDRHLTTKKDLAGLLISLDPEVLLLLGAGDLDREIPELRRALNMK